ncbi:MAG: acyl-CoA/acyl-ACP dehydrogenase [Acidimicrobiaceae bacterium]|nr:acyl-CoA/acyl-ACP dehydrogenase [Acidimicrobiaceae bacterium]
MNDLTLVDAAAVTTILQGVIDSALDSLVGLDINDHQVVAYDVAHAAAAVASATNLLAYGAYGDAEAQLTIAFVADVAHDVNMRLLGREAAWGCELGALDGVREFMSAGREPALLASLVTGAPNHLDEDFALVAETFRRFADDQIVPIAEHIHRTNSDIPEDLIGGLAELGVFGLSAPVEYGGFAEGGASDYLGMVVATEELSRGSLGIGGSLITRPEILTRALIAGGTESQKTEWLPKLASGEIMAAVAVTEPDYGSDVAGIRVSATRDDQNGWVINGTKTWCTFAGRADVLMLLARTTPGSTNHKGLSVFIVSKPRSDGHGFAHEQPDGGRMEGRAIDTIGYRGMHSYEVSFDDWWVPADALIGEADGEGRGFYFQMQGFENGRLQTAARAVGVMQAAYESAVAYANDRVVFNQPISQYQLTQAKIGRMAIVIQAARQYALHVAHLMGDGKGTLEASMVKAYVCRAAEWVTRESMQIHGGMGYAEEYPVSRYYVDARVLSIFEGADEILCLKVIIRRLLADRS